MDQFLNSLDSLPKPPGSNDSTSPTKRPARGVDRKQSSSASQNTQPPSPPPRPKSKPADTKINSKLPGEDDGGGELDFDDMISELHEYMNVDDANDKALTTSKQKQRESPKRPVPITKRPSPPPADSLYEYLAGDEPSNHRDTEKDRASELVPSATTNLASTTNAAKPAKPERVKSRNMSSGVVSNPEEAVTSTASAGHDASTLVSDSPTPSSAPASTPPPSKPSKPLPVTKPAPAAKPAQQAAFEPAPSSRPTSLRRSPANPFDDDDDDKNDVNTGVDGNMTRIDSAKLPVATAIDESGVAVIGIAAAATSATVASTVTEKKPNVTASTNSNTFTPSTGPHVNATKTARPNSVPNFNTRFSGKPAVTPARPVSMPLNPFAEDSTDSTPAKNPFIEESADGDDTASATAPAANDEPSNPFVDNDNHRVDKEVKDETEQRSESPVRSRVGAAAVVAASGAATVAATIAAANRNSVNAKDKGSRADFGLSADNMDEKEEEKIVETDNNPSDLNPVASPTDRSSSFMLDRDTSDTNVTSSEEKKKEKKKKTKKKDRNQSDRTYSVDMAESPVFAMEVEPVTTDMYNNEIYHRNSLAQLWLLVAVGIHVAQWTLLLYICFGVFQSRITIPLLAISILVTLLLIGARIATRKKSGEGPSMTDVVNGRVQVLQKPEDETDAIPDLAVLMLVAATFLEGCLFALFAAGTAGFSSTSFSNTGYGSEGSLIEIMRFASITFLAFHRVIRPANRIDPLRTVLELEVVSVCWDALDGSTFYQLLDNISVSYSVEISIRVLMAFWYASVGARIAIMFATHLRPTSKIYQAILNPPFYFSENVTVDRSLCALRLRCTIIMSMALSEMYAAGIRIYLWTLGDLSDLQIEMFFKNVLFLSSVYQAYQYYMCTINRDWNSRDLGLGLKLPTREWQLYVLRWTFCILYLAQGALLTVILIQSSGPSGSAWILNSATDFILLVWFYFYCRNVSRQNFMQPSRFFLLPQKAFPFFPVNLGIISSFLLAFNMFFFRIPGLVVTANNMPLNGSGLLNTYTNALIVVTMSILTISAFALYWSTSNLLFHKELTKCPDNYYAIHDPITNMVASAAMVEGSLDILSATSLMSLATDGLPTSLVWTVAVFSVLECFNACQCFSIQTLLSKGTKNSPKELVQWKAYLRASRGVIDFGVLVLRIVLWAGFGIVNSVFLIKNIYNLMHTWALVERWVGGRFYSPETMFAREVRPAEWYGISDAEFRDKTMF